MKTIHNNTDMNKECYVWSSKKYDYCIVNGESVTRYYGSKPGEYESFPIHTLINAQQILKDNPWIMYTIEEDDYTLYKRHEELRAILIEYSPIGDLDRLKSYQDH